MELRPTELGGVLFGEAERVFDERGWFSRSYDRELFEKAGVVEVDIVAANTSFNARAGTLRGLHWQHDPYGETKIVRCTQGALFDVAVDVRPDSSTYRRWVAIELTPDSGRVVVIPPGVAHGFVTLAPGTTVEYLMSAPYVSAAACGARFDDVAFQIEWPVPVEVISDRDRGWPPFEPRGRG